MSARPAPSSPRGPPTTAPQRSAILANGELEAAQVLVRDPTQASRLHAKGSVGEPRPNGWLELSIVEAAWSLAEGRLSVTDGGKPVGVADLLSRSPAAAAGAGPGAGAGAGQARGASATPWHRIETEYLVYRDLRERGLVVRPAGMRRFAVWPRGTGQGDPQFHVLACADRDGLPVADLAKAAAERSVLAVADADGQVTHYQVASDQPSGDVPEGDLPRAKGVVLADRVLVSDPLAADAYSRREFLGTRHGSELFLSFVEAEALRRRGALSVPQGLADSGEAARLLPVHLVLRAAGAVPKSGFKFGTHLRAYRAAPDDGHAEWLVHCADAGETLPWSALSRGVRLAHGVRKRFLVALPNEGAVDTPTFAHLSWFRP